MSRLDRALGILLLLQGRKALTAAALARRFEVSPRTIYRDVATLSALGVPVYAQRGRGGGIRLLEGYFLPPVTFTQNEALALVVGLALLDSLRAKPFAADLQGAREKLIGAMPDAMRAVLVNLRRHIGFEAPQEDVFHPEPPGQVRTSAAAVMGDEAVMREDEVIGAFLQGIVSRSVLLLRYHSPYRAGVETHSVAPLGAFSDRGYWYLIGATPHTRAAMKPRLFRADRVLSTAPGEARPEAPLATPASFDIQDYLNRRWLASAMRQWAEEAPVRVRLTERQAGRLRRDWYFRLARYRNHTSGDVEMTFGETDPETVLELIRWMGPGAELLEPASWRATLETQLSEMLACYR